MATTRDPIIIDAVPERVSREEAMGAKSSSAQSGAGHAANGPSQTAHESASAAGKGVKKRATWKRGLIGVLALLYVLSPLDLVPDWIPLVGWLDDIGILAWAARQVFFKKD